MSTFTALPASDLALVTGAVDLGPARRMLSRGIEYGANAAVLGGTGGLVVGGVAGAFGGPVTALAGAGIGAGVGTVGGAIGGFGAGVLSQATRELGRR